MKNVSVSIKLQADLKRLVREPVLMLLFIVPLFALLAIKLMLTFGTPVLYQITGFDLSPWYGYLLSMVLLISPSMLGTVSGFIMIDDRDERITDLMSVTPMGFEGYIKNRLVLPFVASGVYTLLGYLLLNIYELDVFRLIIICVVTGIESTIVGILLFNLADNKVKGLTYAKGLSIFIFTALADILQVRWISMISRLIPFYWISRLIVQPISVQSIGAVVLVHMLWLYFALNISKKLKTNAI